MTEEFDLNNIYRKLTQCTTAQPCDMIPAKMFFASGILTNMQNNLCNA